jgi:hypothetical protein
LANNGHVPEGAVIHRYAGIPVAQYLPGSCQAKFAYREIAAPERIVFINCFCGESGALERNPMVPDWPLEVFSVFRFAGQDAVFTSRRRLCVRRNRRGRQGESGNIRWRPWRASVRIYAD